MTQDTLFRWTLRIYYEDTDAGGIVYYANYLKYFERARTEWLRQVGINQVEMALEYQAMFVVKSTAVDYHQGGKTGSCFTGVCPGSMAH